MNYIFILTIRKHLTIHEKYINSVVRVVLMLNNLLKYDKLIEKLLIFSLLLSFLDSYQLLKVPLSWMGAVFLFIIFVALSLIEKIKIPNLAIICTMIALLPTIFNFSIIGDIVDGFLYTSLRVFSFITFLFITFIVSRSNFKYLLISALQKTFVIIAIFSLYTYFAQIFNFYEPIRNRPGTGVLGFDAQVVFWSSDSHRLIGTFREPLFLVSILFPVFLTLHKKKSQYFYFYILSGILFGLTKSQLALILVLAFFFVQLLMKHMNLKVLSFTVVFLIFFITPIKECDISPSNFECPQISNNETNEPIFEAETFQASSPNDFKSENKERIDTLTFASKYLYNNTGFGFQSTNKIYSEYLRKNVNNEMYLTNRTLPNYLKIQYLSKSFGTGRYFLTYENVNIQNNFLFNFFSIGSTYIIFIFLLLIYLSYQNLNYFLYVTLLVISISLSSVEDLIPVFAVCFGLLFTMEPYED